MAVPNIPDGPPDGSSFRHEGETSTHCARCGTNLHECKPPAEPSQDAGVKAEATAVSAPQGISCPQCSGKAIRGPLITWNGFRISLVVWFMTLFIVKKAIEMAVEKANEPNFMDFGNPFIQKTPLAYVPPDYSIFQVVAVVGLCIVVFLFFRALAAKNTCESCGHRWKS